MSFLGKVAAAAAVAGAVAAVSPASATTVTFAQILQSDGGFSPGFTFDGTTLSASGLAVDLLSFVPGAAGHYTLDLSATTTGSCGSGGCLLDGWVHILDGGTNILSVVFSDANLSAGIGSASLNWGLVNADEMTSAGIFDFSAAPFLLESFSFSFTSGGAFDVNENYIGEFAASGAATFASDPPLPGATPPGRVPSVPEPATWALMLVGFGLVGSGLRNRRRSIAFA